MAQQSRVGKAAWRAVMGIHRALYRRTGGRIGGSMRRGKGEPGRILLLTTTGRRSGRPWTNPLMYMEVGGELMVVASNAGYDNHPAWYLNLQARPEASVQIGPTIRGVRARVAHGDEREHLWAELVRRYPGYGGYQTKTTRQPPLVLLAPDEANVGS
jgi:F420H(2)-dependent quinone reductase